MMIKNNLSFSNLNGIIVDLYQTYNLIQMKLVPTHLSLKTIISLVALCILVNCYSSPTACTSANTFYDIIKLQCSTCPANTNQAKDFTFCNCSNTFYDNPAVIGFNNSQSCLGTTSYNNVTQIVPVFGLDGRVNSSPSPISCVNSYPDTTNTKCIPCGPSMSYSSSFSSCVCNAANYYAINGACYLNTISGYTQFTPIASISAYLAEQQGFVGCRQYGLIQSCNSLMNQCVGSNYSSTDNFCKLLASLQLTKNPSNGLPVYSFSSQITDSISLQGSSIVGTNSSTVKNTFQLMLAEYNVDGSLNDFKPLDGSIFSCYLNGEDIVEFMSFGLNFYKTCSTSRVFPTQYFYDIYIVTGNGQYAQVPISINNVFYKRFTPSAFNSMYLTFVTQPPMQVPFLTLSNATSPSISTVSTASNSSISYIAFFIIFGVLMIVGFIINFYRYMKYNPDENNDPYYCFKAIALFLIFIVKYVAVTIWLWLLCFSAYCFCFYKFQRTVYLMIPRPSSDTSGLYSSFQAFYYTNFSFMIVAIFILLFNMVSYTDYFLIDWQKEKEIGRTQVYSNRRQVSVWRKVLLVNQLYELSINRVINIQMVSLFSLLFLSGLKWINLGSMIPNTSNLTTDDPIIRNPILQYFIITFVIFIIALAQFVLRIAIKTWFPLPIEEFIDLCSVSNISIIIFDESLHGYYLHGMNPIGQSEGSLNQIDAMFEKESKAFGKSRSFKLQDSDQCQTFEVIFPYEIRQAFQVKYKSRYLQKLAGRSYDTSILSNPIPEMLNDEDYEDLQKINSSMLESFKYYLQGVKTSMMNVRERSFLEKLINCPIDTAMMGKLPVFLKDQWFQFSNVLLSGHEFLFLFNFINFVNVFYIATANIYYAFFITFIFQKLARLVYGLAIKRNISRNTLIDDKFFN